MRKIHRLQGGGRTVLWDSFTDADGTTLLAHAANDGAPWRDGATASTSFGEIDANRVKVPAAAVAAHLIRGSRLRRRNGEVSVDVVRVAAGQASGSFIGVLLRAAETTASSQPRWSYEVRFQLTNAVNVWQIIRNTVTTISGNVSQALTQDQAYRLRAAVRGSRILVWVDDVLIFNLEDTQTRKGYRVGMRIQNNSTNDLTLRADNWLVAR